MGKLKVFFDKQKCRLSYAQATEYLIHLNDRGFLKKDGTYFKSTDEGLILLEEFRRFCNKLNAREVSNDY